MKSLEQKEGRQCLAPGPNGRVAVAKTQGKCGLTPPGGTRPHMGSLVMGGGGCGCFRIKTSKC